MKRPRYSDSLIMTILNQAEVALAAMRVLKVGKNAVAISKATSTNPSTVVMTMVFGGGRIIDMLVASNCRGYVREISWNF